jgi:endonuclease-3
MARKSPRSKKKGTPAPRMPGTGRPRAKPGKSRLLARGTATRARAKPDPGARAAHAPRGARARPETNGSPAKPPQVKPASRPPARARTPAPARRALRTVRAKPGRMARPDPERVQAILAILERIHPEARTALEFGTPLQLLIATILSAQCTDERVNQVTPGLFAEFRDAAAFAAAPQEVLEDRIRSTGFFRNKARAIRACTADIVARHGGEVPRTLEELTALHGVGRKTANVVLGNAFGIPGLVVDTHVARLSYRLGLTSERDPVKIEFELMPIVPREKWTLFSHWLILHGRRTCIARKPRCSICPLAPHCPRRGVTVSQ